MHDLDSIYKVPLFMENQGALEFLQDRLNFPINVAYNRIYMKQWKKLSDKYNSLYYIIIILYSTREHASSFYACRLTG